MLRNFRQVFKGQQTSMTVVMVIVLLGLLAYLAPSSGNAGSPETVVARVYGKEIVYRELYAAVEDDMARFGKQANMAAMRGYVQVQALNRLIQQRLVERIAQEKGVVVTDAEVRAHMESILGSSPRFKNADGSFKTADEINDLLLETTNPPMSLKAFEERQRKQLIIQKLMTMASGQVPIDEAWLNHAHRLKHDKLTFEVATLTPDTAAVADPGDAKLDAFMKSQGLRFQVGPRRVVTYVVVDKAHFGKSLDPDAGAIKAAYERKKAEFTELHTAHILIKGESEKDLTEGTKLLQDVRAKVLGGADFLKLAEELSQDPSAKTNRGDLGFSRHGQFAKPYEDAAMALKPGELSQPVRTQFGVHLIKLVERRERTLEEVTPELRTSLLQERFNAKAKEKIEAVRKAAGDRGDLGKAAKAQGLTVKTSQPFLEEAGAEIQGLKGSGMLTQEAFRLKVGQVSKLQRVGEDYVVFRVQEEKAPTLPPMTEIRAKVLEAYRLEEARKAARAKAEAAVAKGDLTAVGTVSKQENKSLSELADLTQHPGLAKALLDTPVGQITPLFWNQSGLLWVAKVLDHQAGDAMTFEQRRALVEELQESQAQKLLGAQVGDLNARGRLRPGLSSLWGRFGGIYVNEDMLKALKEVDSE